MNSVLKYNRNLITCANTSVSHNYLCHMATQRGRPKAFPCLSGQYCEARPLFPSIKTMV